MGLLAFWRNLRRQKDTPGASAEPTPTPSSVDLRVAGGLFDQVRAHVENFSRGEEAGFLICGLSRLPDHDVLLAREWIPIPDRAIIRNQGSVLSWSAEFNSDVLARAVEFDGTPVLVHSHGTSNPRFSPDDRAKERPLFGAFSRIVDPLPTGTLLVGRGDATGSFWINGRNDLHFRRLVIIGDTIETWHSAESAPQPHPSRKRLRRQTVAIGSASDAKGSLLIN